MKNTVLIIEEESLFRQNLYLLFHYSSKFDCIGMYSDLSTCLADLKASPDIIVTTDSYPSRLRLVKKHFPSVPLVLIVSAVNYSLIRYALEAGAESYITKGSEPAVYFSRLQEVLENDAHIKDTVARNFFADQPVYDHPLLTQREKELLPLLAKGLQYKEISILLNISVETVKRHCSNIYEKLEVNNRTEAVNKFLK